MTRAYLLRANEMELMGKCCWIFIYLFILATNEDIEGKRWNAAQTKENWEFPRKVEPRYH